MAYMLVLETRFYEFNSRLSDQRTYFATRLKRANSTNIAAEFAFLSSKSAPWVYRIMVIIADS